MLVVINLIDMVFIESLIIAISFVVYGVVIQRRWHSKSFLICTLLSIALFYLTAKLYSMTIGLNISQFLPVIIGLLLVYAMYRIGIVSDSKSEKFKELENNDKKEEVEVL